MPWLARILHGQLRPFRRAVIGGVRGEHVEDALARRAQAARPASAAPQPLTLKRLPPVRSAARLRFAGFRAQRGIARSPGVEVTVAIVAFVIGTAGRVADETLDLSADEVVRREHLHGCGTRAIAVPHALASGAVGGRGSRVGRDAHPLPHAEDGAGRHGCKVTGGGSRPNCRSWRMRGREHACTPGERNDEGGRGQRGYSGDGWHCEYRSGDRGS